MLRNALVLQSSGAAARRPRDSAAIEEDGTKSNLACSQTSGHAAAAFCDHDCVTEDKVFEGVRRLALAGEYRDYRYQQLGPTPKPPRRLPDGRIDPADLRRYRKERPKTRRFERGTPEYAAARDAGLLKPLPPLVPAPPAAVTEAEEVIGFPLPRLLRRLYLEVGNGGFGPRSGILGVRGGPFGDNLANIVEAHQVYSADPDHPTPPGLIWLFEWGCAIGSLVDCRDPSGRMWAWDPNKGRANVLGPLDQTLADWLGLWLECRLAMPEGTAPPN